jgi:maltose O-acetyltransferase
MAISPQVGVWMKIQWRIRRWLRSAYRSTVSRLIEYAQPDYPDMSGIWHSYGARIGANVDIDPTCYIDRGYARLLEIQDNAVVAMGTAFILHDSSINNVAGGPLKIGRIVVEAGAYLGAFVIVMPGVTIGKGAIVGAGALVNSDVLPNTVAVGRPARPVCNVSDLLQRSWVRAATPSNMTAYLSYPSQVEQAALSQEDLKAWMRWSVQQVDNWLNQGGTVIIKERDGS